MTIIQGIYILCIIIWVVLGATGMSGEPFVLRLVWGGGWLPPSSGVKVVRAADRNSPEIRGGGVIRRTPTPHSPKTKIVNSIITAPCTGDGQKKCGVYR